MIGHVTYITSRESEGGPVKIIKLNELGIEIHWDAPPWDIIREIEDQIEGTEAELIRRGYPHDFGEWILYYKDREWRIKFGHIGPKFHNMELTRLEDLTLVIKQRYRFPRKCWIEAWGKEIEGEGK